MLISYGIFLFICSIVLLIFVVCVNIAKLPDRPLDDKAWQINYDNLYSNLQKYVSNKQEKIHAVLNVRNAFRLLKNGASKEGFAILTDKACYFVGKIYQKKWILSSKSNIQHRIVVSELKGVKIGKLSRISMLIPSILSVVLIALEIKWMVDVDHAINEVDWYSRRMNRDIDLLESFASFGMLIAFIMFWLAIYCLVQTFIIKRTHICMEFTSLTITFPISTLGAQEIKDFYKAVSEVQEHNANSSPIPETPNFINAPNTATPNDKIASLSELSKLYEQGLISEEEFNKLKTEIMSN